MNDAPKSLQRRFPTVLIAVAAIILAPAVISLVGGVFAGHEEGERFLERPAARYEHCVRDTEYMRYHHWELLNEIREAVVRRGERGETNLESCRGCHPNRGRFCNQCHTAASVNLDCWGCHYYPATPEGEPGDLVLGSVHRADSLPVRGGGPAPGG